MFFLTKLFLFSILIPLFIYISGPFENTILDIPIAIFLASFIGTIFSYKNKNVLIFIMCIELILVSFVTFLIIASTLLNNATGQFYALIILALAASETALGLGLLVISYKTHNTVNFKLYRSLRG